jgi:Elongation factor Tu GTP binding domain
MAVERERGISVSSAVMSFEHEGHAFNLLDTPGHQDFSPLGFQRGHLSVPLNADQPFGCHNRMVFLRLSASRMGRGFALEGVGDT